MYNSGIYRLIFPNGKYYIGQSVNIRARLSCYRAINCKEQKKLFNAIKKYGWNNVKYDILLCAGDKENLDNAEIYYIKKFNTIKSGYNIVLGGLGCLGRTCSEDTKKKISAKNKGRVSNRKGVKLSDASKRKISLSKKGLAPWNKGKPSSIQSRQNMRKSHVGCSKRGSSSKYIGVCWNKWRNKWMSSCRIYGKSYHIGYFDDEKLAHKAHENFKKEHEELYGIYFKSEKRI